MTSNLSSATKEVTFNKLLLSESLLPGVVQKNTFIPVAKQQIALRCEKFGFVTGYSNFSLCKV